MTRRVDLSSGVLRDFINMKILILHNIYQQAGGEDQVVANESALLRQNGDTVILHTVSNDGIKGFWRKMATAWQVPYSRSVRKEILEVIEAERPDVVHVHNIFPLLTPSVYDACREAGVPVVQTLHNYRNICPGSLLMREGEVCEKCIQGSPYQAVLHKCYRDSRLGSLAVARMVDFHRRRGTWLTKVDCFIAPTGFSKSKFVEAGFPAEKIVVKPNFVQSEKPEARNGNERQGALFVGRLSLEKGVDTLMRAWKDIDVQLKIVGNGPLMDRVREKSNNAVSVLGRKEPAQVIQEMARSEFLVMPSECYEGFPVILAEAYSKGLPVIASRLGAMAEIVEDGVTGLHFNPGDAEDLVSKVRWASEHPENMQRMGRNARSVYEEKYTPETNYRQLMTIYQEAVMENGRRRA